MSHDKVRKASLAVLSRYTGMLVYPEHSYVQDPHFERLVSLDVVETQYCTCLIHFWQIKFLLKLLCQYFFFLVDFWFKFKVQVYILLVNYEIWLSIKKKRKKEKNKNEIVWASEV